MTSFTDLRALVSAQTATLAPTLYDAVSLSIETTRTRLQGRDPQKYAWLYSGSIRCEVREELEARPLPDGWSVTGDARMMGQLMLRHEEHDLVLRFLKENRANRNQVPHAGHNHARREVWTSQATFQPSLFDVGAVGVSSAGPTTLLLLWGPNDVADLEAGFRLRVVHPIEVGAHVRGTMCDMEIELLQGGTIYDRLEFVGSDESADFFRVDLAEDLGDE